MDNWGSFMFNIMDADIPVLAVLYCCFMVIIGSFFLMNLILAVIIQSFIDIQEKELENDLKMIESQ